MVKHRSGRPRRVFLLAPLRVSQLQEIVRWCDDGRSGKDEDALLMRMYTEFRRQYRPLWSSGDIETLVMTVNRVPVFCVNFLRLEEPGTSPQAGRSVAHIYLLCCPQVRNSARRLLLAWQAATVHAFLPMGLQVVQAAVDADCREENEALVTLGYKLTESVSETAGRMHVYRCVREQMRVVM